MAALEQAVMHRGVSTPERPARKRFPLMAHTQVSLRGQRASFWAGESWGTCGGNGLLGDLHSLVCSSCHMTGGLHKSQGNPGWVETFHWVLRNKHFFVWQWLSRLSAMVRTSWEPGGSGRPLLQMEVQEAGRQSLG